MRGQHYDKYPAVKAGGLLHKGWGPVIARLREEVAGGGGAFVCVVECYQGVYYEALLERLLALRPDRVIDTRRLFKSCAEVEAMTAPYMTADRIFGYKSSFTLADFLDKEKLTDCRQQLQHLSGFTLLYGHGAAEVCPEADLLLYADMSRWEIQQRFRRKEINGLGMENRNDEPSVHYKRGYFIDWAVCDRLKKEIAGRVDYWLDTHRMDAPGMIDGETMREALRQTARRPFRVVPFFDPAPWGGQWMKEVCDLDRTTANYGWCFDCVPEENSLCLDIAGERFEMPANNLVFLQTRALLGAPVEARFGQDFPIRFDFLDTVDGGNLSLQVHPTTQYIRDTFGICYTQDESYYILDAGEDASVYLGLKTGIRPEEMAAALQRAQKEGTAFDVEKYVNKWPAARHDHFLIPAGTVHCSGRNVMVLEISSTPNIFTFKLWDWGRAGLDGRPRPIHIEHGMKVLQWDRDTAFTRRELINRFEPVAEGDGRREERTGLHENEFIETRRHRFTAKVPHHTGGSVNVLNVIEGEELMVESPDGAFAPFAVHYAETFIVPAAVGNYTVRPGDGARGTCGTIKASIRFR
ncbi:MAG: class I mannose-6-phosphate isomerase [Tannerellaceae bacterium]|jgi:mannose-6-phosphate isomerase class I|nr:class I mannose-6-phosphate isomerase [Tannerellaceae bacterium]